MVTLQFHPEQVSIELGNADIFKLEIISKRQWGQTRPSQQMQVVVTPKGVLRLARCNASATREGP